MRVAVVGAGAVGLSILARLCQNRDNNQHIFLVDYNFKRAKQLAQKGYLFLSGDQRFWVPPGSFVADQRPKGLECVILAVKSHSLVAAIKPLGKLLDKNGVVLSIQNGVVHPDILNRFLGRERVVCAAWIASCDQVQPGRILFLPDSVNPAMVIPKSEASVPGMKMVTKMMNFSKISYVFSDDSLESLLWTKAAFIAALGPVSALLVKKNGEILESEPAKELVRLALSDTLSVLRVKKIPLAFSCANDPEGFLWDNLKKMKDGRVSMLQDISRGKKTEIDAIVKPFLDVAREKKMPCPVLERLYRLVKIHERNRGKGKLKVLG